MRLFHISYDDHGPEFRMLPLVPTNINAGEDQKVKRVCTAPRIGDCMRMFPWRDYRQTVHVYAIDLKQLPQASRDLPRKLVPDWKKWVREEVWLLEKAGYLFKRIGAARMFRVEMVTGQPFWHFREGGPSGVEDKFELTSEGRALCVKRWADVKRQELAFMHEIRRNNRAARMASTSEGFKALSQRAGTAGAPSGLMT